MTFAGPTLPLGQLGGRLERSLQGAQNPVFLVTVLVYKNITTSSASVTVTCNRGVNIEAYQGAELSGASPEHLYCKFDVQTTETKILRTAFFLKINFTSNVVE